jgi:hypothetical protein
MTTTPAGIMRHSHLLKKMVAACATFQALTDTADATAAESRISFPALDDTVENPIPWPRAVITEANEFSATQVGRACWTYQGSLYVTFEFVVPREEDAESFENSYTYMSNKVGAIIAEMIALSGTGEPVTGITHLNINTISLVEGPWYQPVAEMSGLEAPDVELPFVAWWATFSVGFF